MNYPTKERFRTIYSRGNDEDRLIADIKRNADELADIQIYHKYQSIFDTWPESRHDLLRILKVLDNEDWQNNSVLNDIRKIMSDVMNRLYRKGFCCVQHDGTNLAQCSIALGHSYMEEIVPVYIQRSIHSIVAITNPGSHRTTTDSDVASGKAPYLIRSLVFEMLTVLNWCRHIDSTDRNEVLAAIESAKNQYEQRNQERGKQNT